jgi:capsular polysaccharide biosynthesis protein
MNSITTGDGGALDSLVGLRWGVRHYAWLILACTAVIGVLVPVHELNRKPVFSSDALVVATDLRMDLKALPRYGAAIFDDGQVAQRLKAEFGDDGDPEDVVPKLASVLTEQDSNVMHVTGHASDARTAALRANVAAAVFVDELNRPGSGVGRFAVQSTASAPVERDEPIRAAPYAVSVGLAAGVIFGLGVVTLLVVLRRPIVDAASAGRIGGMPLLGTIVLPVQRHKSRTPPIQQIRGLMPVCRRLLNWDVATVLLVSARRSRSTRRRVALAIAFGLARVRRVHLRADEQWVDPVTPSGEPGDPTAADARPDKSAITVVDDVDPVDLLSVGPNVTVLLVVREGIGSGRLRALVSELEGAPAGLVLVRRRLRPRRRERPARPSKALPLEAPIPPAREAAGR